MCCARSSMGSMRPAPARLWVPGWCSVLPCSRVATSPHDGQRASILHSCCGRSEPVSRLQRDAPTEVCMNVGSLGTWIRFKLEIREPSCAREADRLDKRPGGVANFLLHGGVLIER